MTPDNKELKDANFDMPDKQANETVAMHNAEALADTLGPITMIDAQAQGKLVTNAFDTSMKSPGLY